MSGFPRINRMLQADIDNVNSIGIITAENPNSVKIAPSENNKRQKQLERDIRSMGYGFRVIGGKFEGNIENPFFVPHMSKNDLITLGKKYNQTSVIYGEKVTKNDTSYFRFEYIEGDKTTNTRFISLSGMDIQNRNDMYSYIKDRKFVIPFFEPQGDIDPSVSVVNKDKVTSQS
jgi:hypothetical protein